MKFRKQKVFLSAASAILALALVFTFAGCGDDDAISMVSTMGAPSVKDMTFDTRVVADLDEAEALWGKLHSAMDGYSLSITDAIREADEKAYDEAFKAAYSMTPSAYMAGKMAEKKVSVSVKLNDKLKLAKAINDETGKTTVTAASIEGSSKSSISSNKTFAELMLGGMSGTGLENGDNYSSSFEANRTFNISEGYASWETSGKTSKLSGIIKTEFKGSMKSTLKDKTNMKSSMSWSGAHKVAAALSFSDGDMGAIFRFTFADSYNEESRSVKGSATSNLSNIEVYGKDGKKIFDINSDDVSVYYFRELPSYFAYDDIGLF